MYIAFKWLLGITFTMWTAVCCLSLILGTHDKNLIPGFQAKPYSKSYYFRNSSVTRIKIVNDAGGSTKYSKLRNSVSKYKVIETAYLHYAMFLATALVVGMVHRKSNIFIITKDKLRNMNAKSISAIESSSKFWYSNITAVSSVAIRECFLILRKLGNSTAWWFNRKKPDYGKTWVNFLLIKRLKDTVGEKNRLNQLLLTSIQENKNLKTRNHLQRVTNNRLMKLIEDSQMYLRDLKARFVSLENLNVTIQQQNVSLKYRMNKLETEKVESDQKLIALVRKVYACNNSELIKLCHNIELNKDVKIRKKVIRNFLEKPKTTDTTHTDLLHIGCSTTTLKPKAFKEQVIPFVCMKPNSKVHHGEYLWTVKDSDGLIERIYEYENFESNYDNGDTIRRIREYSVFCDKDCISDGQSSRTILNERSDFRRSKIADQKFLTGSKEFQTFLRNNKSLVASPPTTPRRCSHLICG